ncbi:hypothetical protein [Citrobacter freundii]|uniref:hypothetical protein n=1 Tax=Citrobacter freundii TaxID=546 RepID=UPI001748AC78|nr:hypothetical protein [Citrobacter freundii]MBD5735289.1 hypothetical protein [Citrobacter freundii]
MNKLMIILVAFSTVSLMFGCVSEEQRLAKCEAKGISRDVCYNEEKEYWNNYSANMSRLQAANTQADAFKESMSDRKKNKHYDDD